MDASTEAPSEAETVVIEVSAPKEEEELTQEEAARVFISSRADEAEPLHLFRTLMAMHANDTAPSFFMAAPTPAQRRERPPPVYSEQANDPSLRAWLENELAGPLRYNVSLTRELVETQRRADFLLTENNVLRRRAEERAQVQQELGQCQQRATVASLSAIIQQQQLLLEQQQHLMGALKALAAGGDPPPRSTPI